MSATVETSPATTVPADDKYPILSCTFTCKVSNVQYSFPTDEKTRVHPEAPKLSEVPLCDRVVFVEQFIRDDANGHKFKAHFVGINEPQVVSAIVIFGSNVYRVIEKYRYEGITDHVSFLVDKKHVKTLSMTKSAAHQMMMLL